MIIKWYPPLDSIFGLQSELNIEGSKNIRIILTMLMEQKPDFVPYAKFGAEDKQPHGLLIWREGTVLTLDDNVQDDNELEMIIMVAGG